jgi:hypothetical protein
LRLFSHFLDIAMTDQAPQQLALIPEATSQQLLALGSILLWLNRAYCFKRCARRKN